MDAAASPPVIPYESSFRNYRKLEDEKLTSWRGANDLARKLGGWKAYASGQLPDISAEPARGDATKPSAPRAPAPGGHAGHHQK